MAVPVPGDQIEEHPGRLHLLQGVSFLPLALTAIPALLGVWELWPLVALSAAYNLLGIQLVRPKRRGGIEALGKPGPEVKGGLHYVPAGLTKLHTFPVDEQETQFPGDPEEVSKRPDEDDAVSPTGRKRPMRFMSDAAIVESDDPLHNRLAIELLVSVRWRMGDSGFWELYIRIPGHTWEEKVANIEAQMRDTIQGIFQDVISQMTPDQFNKQIKAVRKQIYRELKKAVARWGVVIDDEGVRIQDIDYSHGVAKGLANIAVAKAASTKTRIDAAAERNRLEQTGAGEGKKREEIGKGDAKARELMLTAEGTGTKKAAAALGMSGKEVKTLEVLGQAISKGTVVLGETGFTQLFGLGKTILDSQEKGETK